MLMAIRNDCKGSLLLLILGLTLIHFARFSAVEGLRVIYVPEDFVSIQAAIHNATSGDTVFVHQGIYYENIVVNKSISLVGENRSTTIIDGSGLGSVIMISGNRVEISGFTLRNSGVNWPRSGVRIVNSYLNKLSDNIIQDNHIGVLVDSSVDNDISGNNITANHYGLYVFKSTLNEIRGNFILHSSPTGGGAGVAISFSDENLVEGNLIEGTSNVAVAVTSSRDNNFYYNNFVNNRFQVSVFPNDYANIWDAGHPRGGNFWSDYSGPDVYSGTDQDEPGSDGIIDFPYVINLYNEDRYPHLREIVAFHDITVESVTPSESRVYEGHLLEIYVTVANVGNYTETFSVTVYCDATTIGTQVVNSLLPGSLLSLTFAWNTTGVQERIYAVKAEASEVPREKDKSNNILFGGPVIVRSYALSLVKLTGVTPCNQSGYPVTFFKVGTIGYCKVVLNSTSYEAEIALITVNAFDVSGVTLGVVSFKGMVMPGESTFILGLPIHSTRSTGTATVYANAFTDWPYLGGLPYCPEISATFQIEG